MGYKEMWIAADEKYIGKVQVESMIDTIEDLIKSNWSCYNHKVWYEDDRIKVRAGSYRLLGEIMDYLEGEFEIQFDGIATDF